MRKETADSRKIIIMAQAFYGNRTATDIDVKNVDRFILGHRSDKFEVREAIDRTMIELPESNGIVVIYNKFEEEKRLIEKEEYFWEKGYEFKPLAIIPELGIELYSRCIACRMDENGELQSLQGEDWALVAKYFSI